ncbi:MAG: hypothetical protein JXX28_10655 [Deltaproteobacteria bacterium]|nr:hypothetical protein [Deltaproteobacteria bacterium]
MMNLWKTIALSVGLMTLSAPALAGDLGLDVTIVVVDQAGAPIPTAVIRHPAEADRHRVNTSNGEWTTDVLYLPDGSELIFEKGMDLTLEISAPGYVTQKISYQIRKRKNRATVQLEKMSVILEDDEMDDPVIQFGRDKPIDGAE